MEKLREGEGIRRYTFDELKAEMTEEDALFAGTAAFVISMNWIDYQRLKKHLSLIPEFRVVYNTFSTTYLRIVKLDQYNEFLEGKDPYDKFLEEKDLSDEFLDWRKNRDE